MDFEEERTLRTAALFRGLTEAELMDVLAISTRRLFHAGETVLRQGDGADVLFVVLSGFVRLVRVTATGHERCGRFSGPGHLLGLIPVIDGHPHQTSAVVHTDAAVCLGMPRPAVHSRFLQDKKHLDGVVACLCQEARHNADDESDLIPVNATQRLINTLARMAERHGHLDGDRVQLAVPLSTADLASCIGSRRATVGRIVRDLESRGHIDTSDRFLTICNWSTFRYVEEV